MSLKFIYHYYNVLAERNASDQGSHVVRGILLGPLVIDCPLWIMLTSHTELIAIVYVSNPEHWTPLERATGILKLVMIKASRYHFLPVWISWAQSASQFDLRVKVQPLFFSAFKMKLILSIKTAGTVGGFFDHEMATKASVFPSSPFLSCTAEYISEWN